MAANEKPAASFETIVSDWIPPDSISLMWQIFFVSRNRGISPEFHFPWIHDKHNLYCVRTILEDGSAQTTVASLILRHRPLDSGKKFGLIGLVCVAENFRGMGVSTRLLQHAVELAKTQKLTHLVLWTTKPDVYKNLDFETDSTDMFGQVTRRGSRSTEFKLEKNAVAPRIFATVLKGAPAFAKEVVRYSVLNGASISICKSSSTETLVGYTGPMEQVIDLIDHVMPDTWNLNVPEHAPIIEALSHNGYDTSLKPSAVRMTLALDECDHLPDTIPFLDRI
jgi:N-acetylglutamate synthase-like GNAT family acetyltransferase